MSQEICEVLKTYVKDNNHSGLEHHCMNARASTITYCVICRTYLSTFEAQVRETRLQTPSTLCL